MRAIAFPKERRKKKNLISMKSCNNEFQCDIVNIRYSPPMERSFGLCCDMTGYGPHRLYWMYDIFILEMLGAAGLSAKRRLSRRLSRPSLFLKYIALTKSSSVAPFTSEFHAFATLQMYKFGTADALTTSQKYLRRHT